MPGRATVALQLADPSVVDVLLGEHRFECDGPGLWKATRSGNRRTSTTVSIPCAPSIARNSSIDRVEWPIVQIVTARQTDD